jgi:hypothetical protein
VKWIDFQPMVRCPMNKMCNKNYRPGPGANLDAGRQDCYVPPYEDSALVKVAQAHPDLVGVGPIMEATSCINNGAHLSGADNKAEAMSIAAFYASKP